MNINYNQLLKKLLPLILLIITAYTASTILFFFLPKTGIDFTKEDKFSLKYQEYSFLNNTNSKPIKKTKATPITKKEYPLINSLILKAVYLKSDHTGWIVIEEKSNKKSHFLKKNDTFKGYTLKHIEKVFVVFQKETDRYKLQMKQKTLSSLKVYKNKKNLFKRSEIKNHIQNFSKIRNHIQIAQTKNKKFQIKDIVKGSLFDQIGLKKDDIIKKINNIKINNMSKLFLLYNQIDTIDSITIEIQRDNTIKELHYEIY